MDWVERYKVSIDEGRRVRLVYSQRTTFVFDEDSDEILRSRPASTWKLLRWVRHCESAVRQDMATPAFPKPGDYTADMKRRRTPLELPYVRSVGLGFVVCRGGEDEWLSAGVEKFGDREGFCGVFLFLAQVVMMRYVVEEEVRVLWMEVGER